MISITDSMDMSLSKLWEMVKNREAWSAAVYEVTKSWTQLRDCTTTTTTTRKERQADSVSLEILKLILSNKLMLF